MKRTVLTYGLIAGVPVSLQLLNILWIAEAGTDLSFYIGMGTMLLTFAITIYLGIKNYRDKYSNGIISFGNAFTVGALIALVASCIYVITWAILYNTVASDFLDTYHSELRAEAIAGSATTQELSELDDTIAGYKSAYANPVTFVLYTLWEILPVGLFFALVYALILRKRPGA